MNGWRFVIRSLFFHRRINVAVALGVAAATAVLTGALIVGDSVRGSLRELTLSRLGRIDQVLVVDRFFRDELVTEMAADPVLQQSGRTAVPAILFTNGTAESRVDQRTVRATKIAIFGVTEEFFDLSDPPLQPEKFPGDGEILLNQKLADDLQADVGDEVVLRLPAADQVPADSPLGKKSDRVRSMPRLKVVAILPNEGLGRFSLMPTQTTPRNAYVAVSALQDVVDQPGKINAVLVSGTRDGSPATGDGESLEDILQPNLSDYGYSIERKRLEFDGSGDGSSTPQDQAPEVIYDYFTVTSDRMMIPPTAEKAARAAFETFRAQPVLTYLANSIDVDGNGSQEPVPYSLISAVDSTGELGPLVDENGEPLPRLADDEIIFNSWIANDLEAKVGDTIEVTYFQPETTHGQLRETTAQFELVGIVELTEPATPFRRNREPRFDQRPTLINDPYLTPEVEGVTDQDSISSWEAPFPVDYSRVRSQDDEYWQNHRTTPKAFVSLAAGQRLWGSRFGKVTSFRIPAPSDLAPGSEAEEKFIADLGSRFADELDKVKSQLGFTFLPVKQRGLEAASGTTPFDQLFLALSMFIIAAAVMLVALLFRLGIEQRADEIGVLLATGISRGKVGRMLIGEGFAVSATGGLLGVAIGIGYAWLMLTGLRTWWVGAIVTPFLSLFVTWQSLAIGYVSGVVVSLLTIVWSLRRMRRVSLRRLLSGQATDESELVRPRQARSAIVAGICFVVAIGLVVAATQLGGEAQAGSFVGGGAMLLTAMLILIRNRLRSGGAECTSGHLSLGNLAVRNAGRNPSRSTLTIGLMAAASFLIVAMSSFRLDPSIEGAGGNPLIAESSQPVFANLDTEQGREELLADYAEVLDGARVHSFRVRSGEDASCNNLYQAVRPRVLGVTEATIAYYDDPDVMSFQWAASAAETDQEQANPWRLLERSADRHSDAVPVVLDRNTAMFSLHLYKGIGEEFDVSYPDGTNVRFRVAGLLANSVLQGSLMIGEADFLRRFPDVSGYEFFLIRPREVSAEELEAAAEQRQADSLPQLGDRQLREQLYDERLQKVSSVLEDRLGDQGFDVQRSRDRLADLLAVQNTYLSTFQSLGALGLLLGTFGLATVQLRNVLERRGELALMRAAGFRRRRLAAMVMFENIALLLGGLLTGFLAALIAVVPHMIFGGASVPLVDLAVMLVVVLVVGVLSSLTSVRATLNAPLVAALRGS